MGGKGTQYFGFPIDFSRKIVKKPDLGPIGPKFLIMLQLTDVVPYTFHRLQLVDGAEFFNKIS